MEEKKQVPQIRFKGYVDAWEQRKWIDVVDISTEMVNPTATTNGIKKASSGGYGTDSTLFNSSYASISSISAPQYLLEIWFTCSITLKLGPLFSIP